MAWLSLLVVALSGGAAGFRYKYLQVNLIDSRFWLQYPAGWIIPNIMAGALIALCLYLVVIKAYSWVLPKRPKKFDLVVCSLFAPNLIYWIIPDLWYRAHFPVLGFFAALGFLLSWLILFFRDSRWRARLTSQMFLDTLLIFIFNGAVFFRLLATDLGDIVGFMFGLDAGALAKYYQFPAWNPEMYTGGVPYFYSYFNNTFIMWLMSFGPVSPANPELFRIWVYRLPYLLVVCLSGSGMYLAIRRAFGLGRLAALFTGLIFTLNFYMQRVLGCETLHLLPSMAFPWVFWLMVEGFDRRSLKWLFGAGIVFGAVWGLFFVHPENFYCLYMVLAAFGLLKLIKPGVGQSRYFALKAMTVFFLAHGAFSYFFFPYFEFITQFKSSLGTLAADRLQYGFRDYLPFVMPFFTGYTTALLVIFSLLSAEMFGAKIMAGRKFGLYTFSLAAYVFFALVHYGPSPLNWWMALNYQNPFPYVHFWHRSAPIVFFFQYVLAAMGVELIQRLLADEKVPRSYVWGRIGLGSGLLCLLVFWAPGKFDSLATTVYHLNDVAWDTVSGRRHFYFAPWYVVFAILSVCMLALSQIWKARAKVYLFSFLFLSVVPLLHYMDERIGLIDRGHIRPVMDMVEDMFTPAAKLPEAWAYLRRSPEDWVARDYAADFVKAPGDYTRAVDAELRSWLLTSNPPFFAPYLTGQPWSRYVESDVPGNNPGVTFEFKRNPFFNSVISLSGNVGRPHLWRWLSDFDLFYPWSPGVDNASKVSWNFMKFYRMSLDMLGTRYIAMYEPSYQALSREHPEVLEGMSALAKVESDRKVPYVWIENHRAMPLMNLVNECRFNSMAGLKITALHPLTEVLMSNCPSGSGAPGPALPPPQIVDIRGNIAAATLPALSRDAYLFFSQMYHPDWRLVIDGKITSVEKANLAFLGAAIPAGSQNIWFEFRSRSLWVGFSVSLLIVFCFLAICHFPNKKRQSEGIVSSHQAGMAIPLAVQKWLPYLVWLPSAAAIAFMFFRIYVLRDVPFQGEHWELLDDFTSASGFLGKLDSSAFFICFGHVRFQPLAFLIPTASYMVFGHHYVFHYLASMALYIGTIYFTMQLYQLVTTGKRERHAFKNYPLETAFLLSSYIASDVLSWTFFHYIQLATLFSVIAFYWIFAELDNPRSWRRWAAVGLFVFNMLTYEAYFAEMALVFLIFGLKWWTEKKLYWRECLVLLIASGVIFYNLLDTNRAVVPLSETFYWMLPWSNKVPFFVLYSLTLYFWVALYNMFWLVPLGSWLGLHFGLMLIPEAYWTPLIYFGFWLVVIGLPWLVIRGIRRVLKEKRFRADSGLGLALCILAGVGVAAAVIYGRRESQQYALFQFRYVYSAMPFVIMALFSFLRKGPPKLRIFLLLFSVVVSIANSDQHLRALQYTMAPITSLVKDLKAKGMSDEGIIYNVMRERESHGFKDAPLDTQEFIYNGTKCHHY